MQWKEVSSQNIEALTRLAQELQINPLALEDCLHRNQRAKFEDYGNHQFLVWFLLVDKKIYELQFLLFPDLILFVPHDKPPSHEAWKEFFRIQDDSKDVARTLYQILDRSMDVSMAEVRLLFSKIQHMEESIFEGGVNDLKSILPIRKQLAAIEMEMSHLPTISEHLQTFYHPKDDLKWKFRDLRDHCERLYQGVIFHETQIASLFELFWAVSAQKTNLQVKRLTMLASITVPMTFWASFWGMNFEAIPYNNPSVFYAAIALMVASALGTYFFLRLQGYWTDQ
jgi:magnesium transporter